MAEIEFFSERQSLAPKILGIGAFTTALVGFYAYVEIKNTPGAEIGLFIIGVTLIILFVLFNFLGLTTIVTEEGVRVKGLLFVNRLIRFDEIATAEKRIYKPIGDFGGWGYRVGPSGKAYNAQGNEGVQLVLNDGGRVLIGSQKSDELATIIAGRISK